MTKTDSSNPSLSAVAGSAQRLSDDDVYLLKLWITLANRKGVVLAILLISLITAGLFIFFTPPVYESRAVLQVGQVGQAGQLESPAVLAKRLMTQDDMVREKTTIGKFSPFIQTAFMEKETNLISIIARGPAPDATQGYLAHVIAEVMREHQELFDLARKEYQQSLNRVQSIGQDVDRALAANEKELGIWVRQPVMAGKVSALRVYFASEKSKLLEQRALLEQRQTDLRMAMSYHSKPTALIKAPTLAVDPLKPRPLLYFTFALGIGLMLGILCAYVAEFIGKARRLAAS